MAWRPDASQLKEVACVPYDVINTEEAIELAIGKKKSFLHVIRPEIDLEPGTDLYSDAVYEKGAENLEKFCSDGTLIQENHPTVYVYRLIRNGKPQFGLFVNVSVDDYDNDLILKHELTRPDKEDDRTRHIITQKAHAEPVLLTYRGKDDINARVAKITEENTPLYDFTADDGIQHTIWKTDSPEFFEDAFKNVKSLYVADGHHRCKSASRTAEAMRAENPDYTGDESWNFFPAVLVPMEQMEILAYNRVIHRVSQDTFDKLRADLNLKPTDSDTPDEKGRVCIYFAGSWYSMDLPVADTPNAVEKLDASRLQQHVLEPYFGIKNPRTDKNISFVGGIRGTAELTRLVNTGKAQLAISMYPTSIEELVEVSDAGLLMPPKSTWFEPKLRSGLLVHRF